MLHVNPELREMGIRERLIDMTLPEIYVTTSITDFLSDRKNVKPTSFLRSLCYDIPLRTGGRDFLGRTLIGFFDVRYWVHENTPYFVDLEDNSRRMTQMLYAPEQHYKYAEEQGLVSGDKVQLAAILYDPRGDSRQLLHVEKHLNIPTPDLSRADIKELIPALGFSY